MRSLTLFASVTSSTVEQSTGGALGFFGLAAFLFCANTAPHISNNTSTATRVLLIAILLCDKCERIACECKKARIHSRRVVGETAWRRVPLETPRLFAKSISPSSEPATAPVGEN